MQEVYVRSLDREDPLEEGMATHSSTLARIIPWMEKPGGLQSIGSQRVRHDSACICSQVKSSQSHSVVSNSYDPMDCSPQGSSVHGILQARILEWVAIPFSRGSSWPRFQTRVSCVAARFFTVWATREAPYLVIRGKLIGQKYRIYRS